MTSLNHVRASLAFMALCLVPALASAQVGGVFDLSWHTIDGGGIQSASGGSFEIVGTLGQFDASGEITGGSFSLTGGFWPGTGEAGAGPCSVADFAIPYGVLDFFDVSAFLNAFSSSDPSADLNSDSAWDFFDVQMYLNAFSAGCP